MSDADYVQFADDGPVATPSNAAHQHVAPWRVLIVDDDEDVHHSTEFALAGLDILGRPIEFLHAYSALDAIDLLMHEQNVAVILLDVVMESDDSGLAAVTTIRRDLGLANTQIILRTGQPGYAPEIETIRRYDINDYRTKSELSRVKLYTALTSACRAYEQLCRLDADRHALELVVDASNRLLDGNVARRFGEVVLERAAILLEVEGPGSVISRDASGEYVITATYGSCPAHVGEAVGELTAHCPEAAEIIKTALEQGMTHIDHRGSALYFPSKRNAGFIAYLQTGVRAHALSRQMIDVFCSTVSLCSENVQLVNRLSDLAFTDALTDLASRRAFAVELDRRLAAVARSDTAVALLDLDQFAELNDMFGHAYGDKILRAIANRLRDNMPEDVLIARLAGDTFAMLGLPEQLAPERWRPLLNKPFEIDGEERSVSVASALVPADQVAGEALDLIKDASIVIKRAKMRGVGRHADYDPALSAESRTRARLMHDLGLAFRHRKLFLEYQPQMSLRDGRVVGLEALLRWRDDNGKLVSPAQFIPIAEHSGLIVSIGFWVIETALTALARLKEAGFGDLRMAINVSPQQFKNADFVSDLCAAIDRSGIPPGHFEIEVTESMAILGLDSAAEQIDAIRQHGMVVAIDDFGTGYSSLSYLEQLKADRLKIDRIFIAKLEEAGDAPRLAQTIIALGQQMRMSTLAEGVENVTQAEVLRKLGCDEAQGYHFARPMLFDDLLGWLQRQQTPGAH